MMIVSFINIQFLRAIQFRKLYRNLRYADDLQ